MVNAELTFRNHDGHLLVIMPSVVERLLTYRQLHLQSMEAAGVLIGERRGPHLVIHEISEPGSGDIRARYSVDRRGPHHQAAVDDAFARSSGALQYLGEWHTHPEDEPSPSPRDMSSWRRHLVDSEKMALVIVGRKQIWAAQKVAGKVSQLVEI